MDMPSQSHATQQPGGEPLASHEVRLSAWQWVVVAAAAAAGLALAPYLWQRVEPLSAGDDYRIPYELSEDYWLYGRLVRQAATEGKTLVIGDSVVWGQYVSPTQTLTHHLNGQAGKARFANLGVNGTHPLALAGLIEYYGQAAAGRRVLLHCNPLWLASDDRDLRSAKPVSFNHPRLVPQFAPRIPSYKAGAEDRLKVVFARPLPYDAWARHLRLAYFNNVDIPAWTVENPDRNPIAAITLKLPQPPDRPRYKPVPWRGAGLDQADLPWVDLSASLQWSAFKRSVEILTSRGSQVFVCLGPLNEHMLTEPSRARYRRIREGMESWLRANHVPYFAPPALPSDLYADASHPVNAGYALLAGMLLENASFAEFCRMDTLAGEGAARP